MIQLRINHLSGSCSSTSNPVPTECLLKHKKPQRAFARFNFRNFMAGTTRLELATSAVTGQRSNQLNYVPAEGVNRHMVGTEGFEPSTFRV
jgi:hypothetical protein